MTITKAHDVTDVAPGRRPGPRGQAPPVSTRHSDPNRHPGSHVPPAQGPMSKIKSSAMKTCYTCPE